LAQLGDPSNHVQPFSQDAGPIAFRSSESGELRPTVLGAKHAANPYQVDTMTNAWNLLYRQSVPKLPVTDYYVKFYPQDLEQVELLVESGIAFFDFPLGHEVIELGDYYPQENLDSTAIPCFYAVLPQGQAFPAMPYEILEELVLAPYSSLLAYAAFRISGLPHEGFPGVVDDPRSPLICDPDCPNFICCSFGGYDCEGVGAPPYCRDVTIDCNPWMHPENWPACLEGGGGPDPPAHTNACGCAIPGPSRQPAGCIRVQDVELGQFEGVRRARVIWWDGWFRVRTAETSQQGCWSIPGHRESGKAYMWVEFRNADAKLRGFIGNTVQLWRAVLPITSYVGQLGGGVYNNILVEYPAWANVGSAAHRDWAAGSMMNALAEHREQSLADGITPPPYLDIYLASGRRDGFALMKRYLGPIRVGIAISEGLLQASFFDLALWVNYGIPNYSIIYPVLPDMMIGADFQNSDRFRGLSYHELAHASHFMNVGPNYWQGLAAAEIAADGWGNANSADAGRIAICESWAEHIAWTYAHRKYQGSTSIGVTWGFRLETTRNHAPNHIPIGLYHDLIDDANNLDLNVCDRNGPASPPACGGVVADEVRGFTNGQLFSILLPVVVDIEPYRLLLINQLLGNTPNTLQQVNGLFDSY
jgi:hypothetical protein